MFEGTKVKDEYNLLNIEKHFLNARNIEINDFLSKKLNMISAYLIAYNSWHLIDGKLYFYKNYNIFNELFLSELIKEYNLRTLEYQIVNGKKGIGIISESFKKEENSYLDYDYYFLEHKLKAPTNLLSLDVELSKLINAENKIQLMNEFYRLTAFDWFTGQTDRSDGNIIFETTSEKTQLSPIFDNGAALHYAPIKNNSRVNYKSLYSKLYSSYDNLDFVYDDDDITDYNLYLFDLINDNYELYKYLCLSLNIDINEILNRTIDKYKLLVPSEDRRHLIKFFNIKKSILEKNLSLAKKYKY